MLKRNLPLATKSDLRQIASRVFAPLNSCSFFKAPSIPLFLRTPATPANQDHPSPIHPHVVVTRPSRHNRRAANRACGFQERL